MAGDSRNSRRTYSTILISETEIVRASIKGRFTDSSHSACSNQPCRLLHCTPFDDLAWRQIFIDPSPLKFSICKKRFDTDRSSQERALRPKCNEHALRSRTVGVRLRCAAGGFALFVSTDDVHFVSTDDVHWPIKKGTNFRVERDGQSGAVLDVELSQINRSTIFAPKKVTLGTSADTRNASER